MAEWWVLQSMDTVDILRHLTVLQAGPPSSYAWCRIWELRMELVLRRYPYWSPEEGET